MIFGAINRLVKIYFGLFYAFSKSKLRLLMVNYLERGSGLVF